MNYHYSYKTKIYKVISKDMYDCEYLEGIFKDRKSAEKYVEKLNKDTIDYLQQCADDYEKVGNYVTAVEIIECTEEDLQK